MATVRTVQNLTLEGVEDTTGKKKSVPAVRVVLDKDDGQKISVGGVPVELDIQPRDSAEWDAQMAILRTKYPTVFQLSALDKPDLTDERALELEETRKKGQNEMVARAIVGWNLISPMTNELIPCTMEERLAFLEMVGTDWTDRIYVIQSEATADLGNSGGTPSDGLDTVDG